MKSGAGLVVTRALAGMGAAMRLALSDRLAAELTCSTPSAIGIIATNFHGRARSTAFACFSADAPVGGGLGLVLGGVLTAYSP
jgi:MFS family permease